MSNRSDPDSLPARIWRKWREVGPLYALQLIYWELIPHWIFDLNAWVVCATDIRRHAANETHDPAIRWATERDTDAIAACGVERDKIVKAFARGSRIAVLDRDGRVLVHGWYDLAAHEQDDWLTFCLEPDDVMGASIWVQPDQRGGGLAPRVIGFVWSDLAREGYARTIGIINALNRNSRRACKKAGVVPIGRLFYVRFLGLVYMRYGARSRIGFWNSRNRLNLALAT